jgi:RNA polymerase sigma factor (sigma-70 family)
MADDVGSSHVRTDFGELSDAELVRATRDGSRRAYAALWKRHSVSALKYARTLTSSDADDVVSEAFLKVYAAIKAGRGPEEDFRYYIRSAVRNTYVSMVRARRTAPAGDAIEDVIGDRGADVASVRSFDGSATTRAFLSLPARWQEVLWYTEVEGLSREHTASLMGMNANAVSALSFRAREALRTAWLQEHISTHSDLDRGCEAITPMLGAYSRQGLSRRDRLRVEHHVNGCAHCTSVVGELSELLTPGRLALILLPVVLTGGGFAAFVAKYGGGSAVLASATTIAPSTASVVVTVGGSSAATGAAALSVVGKVAACALVATMIVPPTQLLIEAAQHPARHAATVHDAAEPPSDIAAFVHLDTLVGHPPAVDGPPVATESESDSSSDDEDAGGSEEVPADANAGANGSGNAGGNPTPGANANAGGNGRSTAGERAIPVPAEKANPNANPGRGPNANPSPNADPNANANPAGDASRATGAGSASEAGAAPTSAGETAAADSVTPAGSVVPTTSALATTPAAAPVSEPAAAGGDLAQGTPAGGDLAQGAPAGG